MTSNDNFGIRDQIKNSLDLDSAGIMAALERAAIQAHRRAIETSGSYAVYRDGEIVRVTEVPGLSEDKSEGD